MGGRWQKKRAYLTTKNKDMEYRTHYDDAAYVFCTFFTAFVGIVFRESGVNWVKSPEGITYKADSLKSIKFNA